ncbi:MAG: hypothetical protein O8C67_12895, partial [Candidatus Methanoperedens sp.]|nr:hypothetical protein [Candidatus Methanoperedens sp.]
MVSKNKIVTTVTILLLLSVLFSGCTGEKNIAPGPDSIQKEAVNVSSQNLTQSKEGNIPEIKITSFTSIYLHNNLDNKDQTTYNISEKYYAAYNLSIKNNGSIGLDFRLNDLRLHDGDRINTTALEPYGILDVLRDLENENKLQDTTLLPGQSLNGIVVFRVNSLYNESFLLMYNTTPVTSASFEKSIEALRTAEKFNYSVALGVPPYTNCNERGGENGSYEPKFDGNCDAFANWVNRSIFETFQKSDVERMRRSPLDNIPQTKMVYALRVIPEKN